MTFTCRACGEQWERHPVTRVPCPTCRAPAGAWCVRPSGHKAQELHIDREQAALDAGVLQRCLASPPKGDQQPAPERAAARRDAQMSLLTLLEG